MTWYNSGNVVKTMPEAELKWLDHDFGNRILYNQPNIGAFSKMYIKCTLI
jgi:hypothetical protein